MYISAHNNEIYEISEDDLTNITLMAPVLEEVWLEDDGTLLAWLHVEGALHYEVFRAERKAFFAGLWEFGYHDYKSTGNNHIVTNEQPGDYIVFCPKCGERIATRYITKIDKKEAYRFVPSAFNSKKVKL
jgi:hypothetical protein